MIFYETGFSSGPAARVVLTYRDGGYVPTPDLMRWEPPQAASLGTDWPYGDVVFDDGGNPPPELMPTMIELVYGGHGARALDYLDQVWDGPDEGKSAFRADFRDALVRSAYWPAIADLNGWDIDDPF